MALTGQDLTPQTQKVLLYLINNYHVSWQAEVASLPNPAVPLSAALQAYMETVYIVKDILQTQAPRHLFFFIPPLCVRAMCRLKLLKQWNKRTTKEYSIVIF